VRALRQLRAAQELFLGRRSFSQIERQPPSKRRAKPDAKPFFGENMENPYVLLETSEGDILIELFPEAAPVSVENFLSYVDAEHFDGTIFHRVVRNFVIQGGGYGHDLVKKPTRDAIVNEAANGLKNEKGTVAMARAPEKDSATDEFYINAADNPDLDHEDDSDEGFGYAVFGRVEEGMDVVKKINWKVVKERGGFPELPVDTVSILAARRFE
jgi:cyclophilin family peptidyl-prolyl cis-trans isomerase